MEIVEGDFLFGDEPRADYVIGNPPYVPITQLSETEKTRFRTQFETAYGRFDLYILFFEQALRRLRPGGRLVFVTPEKYLSVDSARPLRVLMARHSVREIVMLPESTFPGLVTYPAVTVVDATRPEGRTRISLRDGSRREVVLPEDGSSVNGLLFGSKDNESAVLTLADVTRRISCGVATGADRVFVRSRSGLPAELEPFAFPTIAGRQLDAEAALSTTDVMLVPYDRHGALIDQDALGSLGCFLEVPERKKALLKRTCVRRKPWYAFHETPPMDDLLRPKLLCKDIAGEPRFWMDRQGTIIPRHSVYYIVPNDPGHLDVLAEMLNSRATAQWLIAHAQPAANGYRRLQSGVLKQIPMPEPARGRLSEAPARHDRYPRQMALPLTA